ncbi:hypothetical protein, partial [Lactococcus petauri]|uniref:hypothetical protein n=1 Tax=Lactococcus petauri TaxID=1940789 RepID=UPI0021F0B584
MSGESRREFELDRAALGHGRPATQDTTSDRKQIEYFYQQGEELAAAERASHAAEVERLMAERDEARAIVRALD